MRQDPSHEQPRPCRPTAATSRAELEVAALELFHRDGFDATTVDRIAEAAGVSRRTFFRYYASKNDVVWGDFDAGLRAMEARLAQTADDVPLLQGLGQAVVAFNALPPAAVPAHRQRMALILHVPALQAHSTLRYAAWREVVARFAACRMDLPVDALAPQLVGHVALAISLPVAPAARGRAAPARRPRRPPQG